MKKLTAILLSALMLMTVAGCGSTAGAGSNSVAGTNTAASTASTAPTASGTASTDKASSIESNNSSKTLVAYFSATNTTEGVAEIIAQVINGELYEIVPQIPYTDADLNYRDSSSRSTVEMNDASNRPAINGRVSNMEQFDVIYLGYPIWWGDAPRIIDTFVESYDLSGKTIIPFCTSGSTGIDTSVSTLKSLAPSAKWLSGDRLKSNITKSEVEAWVNGLGL